MKVKGKILFKKIRDYGFCWRNVATAEILCNEINNDITEIEWNKLYHSILNVHPDYPDCKPLSKQPWRPNPVDMQQLAEVTKELENKYKNKMFEVKTLNKKSLNYNVWYLTQN